MTRQIASILLSWLWFSSFGTEARAEHLRLIPEESSVSYKLVHPLHEIEATSKNVQYLLDADVATKKVEHVAAEVDVTTFDSGNSNRDSHAMEVIDAITYPDVRFISTSINQSGDSIHVTGRLTFHGITRDVTIGGILTWSKQEMVMHGGFDLSLEAFKIERPSLLMIPVEDKLSFSVTAAFILP
jgi:polyisoprenoid-binding protein YceI